MQRVLQSRQYVLAQIISHLSYICVYILVIIFGMIPAANAGQAILSWDPPTTNTDGTTLTDLAGYKLYYGTSSGNYSTVITAGSVITYTVTGLIDNTTYYFAATAYDASGNESTFSNEVSKTVSASSDVTAPVVSNVTTSSITSDSATISWTTNEASSSQVEYGTSISYGLSTAIDNTQVTSHSVTLSGLTAWTTYNFRIKSQDASANLTVSSDFTFTTIAPPDTTLPAGTILINDGAAYTSSASVTLTLSCSDAGTGCSQMQLSNDGTTWSTLEPFATTKSWTLSGGQGSKTVYAIFRDGAGNTSTNYTDTISLDSAAPALSSIGTSGLSNNSVTITWTTDEVSTSQVEYGTITTYGSSSPLFSNNVTSHSVTLNNLSASTTYYFRVISIDVAGNQGISAGANFTTQKVAQPDIPTAIQDLTVRVGASTRNSVILDWTATGADGVEGTASAYDLRMSTQKIIEDGLTTAQGEINFSNAVPVTGVSAPTAAGSTESVQVGQLETNSIYFFAIKAIDEKGNVSGISNVINSNNLPPLPVTSVRQGYTMISLPLVPSTTDVQTLFGGIVGTTAELYWWSSNGLGGSDGAFIAETNVVAGYGYMLKSDTDNAVLNITGTAITAPSVAIPLQPGWNMIGNPYTSEVALRNTYVRRLSTGELKNYEDAVIAGWIGNAIYNFNGSTYDFNMYTDSTIKLWQGYWVSILQGDQYELVIYKP